jgi:hypothetical protein
MSNDDQSELSRLVMRYAQAVDRLDLDAIIALMAPHATIATHRGEGEPAGSMAGHGQIRAGMARLERYVATFHMVGNHLFDIDGDSATGETYCTAHHVERRDGVLRDVTMYIRYHDRFVRDAGRWLFSQRKLWIDFSTDHPTGL